jgi:hypothetical protein
LYTLKSNFLKISTLDSFSLGLFRIIFGLILIIDLFDRGLNFKAHYTSTGVLPPEIAKQFVYGYPLSFYFLTDNCIIQIALFIGMFVAAIMFMVGWQTRLANILICVFLLSIQNGNQLVLQGGDYVLYIMFFWSNFLPLGASFAFDSKNPFAQKTITGPSSFAFISQLTLIYIISGLKKLDVSYWLNGQAIYVSLQKALFKTDLSHILLNHPVLLKLATYGTLMAEIVLPLLLLVPFCNSGLRLIIITSFMVFHLFLATFLKLDNFPWVCMGCWIALLPTLFWQKLLKNKKIKLQQNSEQPTFANSILASGCLIMVVLWNLQFINKLPSKLNSLLVQPLDSIGDTLRFRQVWSMFALECGFLNDSWISEVQTVDSNNKAKNILVKQKKTDTLPAIYENGRWLAYFDNLAHATEQQISSLGRTYTKYLCSELKLTQNEQINIYIASQNIDSQNKYTELSEKLLYSSKCKEAF